MKELFSLGELYVSDFIKQDTETTIQNYIPSDAKKYELKLMLDEETGAVRLEKPAPMNTMYGKYWYRSGINATMKNELSSIVDSITKLVPLKENDIWLDIACNDGTLLSYVPKNIICVGIDPADDSFKKESEKHADIIVQDYFSQAAWPYGLLKAKVVTCIAMFYDLDDPNPFLKDVYDVMDDNGLFVLQLSYTPLMIHQVAFDNICHEHIYYYSLFNMMKLLDKNGFEVVDCQLNDVNGGSFRLYVVKNTFKKENFATQPYRDVCDFRIASLIGLEMIQNISEPETWLKFKQNIDSLKNQVVSFIKEEKSKGKRIWGYGASTKGNTLLQYFGLDNSLIDGIAERSTYKWGLKTIGTDIPIYSENEMRKAQPDYLLVLPWHFVEEFKKREDDYLKAGGKFIVPCPKFEVVGL
jgi:SAM-dependent methyltransferase